MARIALAVLDERRRILTYCNAGHNPVFLIRADGSSIKLEIGGLVLGAISMIAGTILFLFGIVGSTSWTAHLLGAESKISDAAPGSVLFVVGLFVVLISRFSMRIQTSTGSRYESY